MENNKYLREEILRMSGVNTSKCMKCGKCSATCPAYNEMEYHPHQFVSMVQNNDIEPLLKSESLYKCLSCFACVYRFLKRQVRWSGSPISFRIFQSLL